MEEIRKRAMFIKYLKNLIKEGKAKPTDTNIDELRVDFEMELEKGKS